MLGRFTRRAVTAFVAVAIIAGTAVSGEIYSTMRNVNAVPESHGYMLNPVFDVDVPRRDSDLAPPQAFEIIRPDDDRPVTIGRLFTSCTCIQLEAHKRTFRPGERAILQLRNIRPTPPNGQVYAIFVQITSPIRATLRFDTFVQTGTPDPAAPIAAATTGGLNPNAPTPIPLPDEPRLGGVVIIQEDPPTPPSATGTAAFLDAAPATEADAASTTAAVPAADAATSDADDAPTTPAVTTTEEVDHASVDSTGSFLADLPTLDSPDVARPVPGPTIQILTEDLPATLEAAQTGLDAAASQVAAAGEELRAAVDPTLAAYSGTITNTNTPPIVAGGFGDDLPDFNSPIPADIGQPIPAVTPGQAEPASVVPAERAAALTPAATSALDIAAPTPSDYDLPAFDATPGLAASGTPVPPPARDPNARRPVQAVSLITIGVRDMPASIRFYEALGWQRAARGKYDQTAFFQLQGQILALYPMQDQLREQNMAGAIPAPGGITLALHVSDKADVWSVYQRFIDAGGTSLRPPAEMASGAVSSYVADPDGNPWEISWVPQFRIDAEGGLWLP